MVEKNDNMLLTISVESFFLIIPLSVNVDIVLSVNDYIPLSVNRDIGISVWYFFKVNTVVMLHVVDYDMTYLYKSSVQISSGL